MLELAIAAAFFAVLALLTLARRPPAQPVPVEVSPMRAALERRMREGAEFHL